MKKLMTFATLFALSVAPAAVAQTHGLNRADMNLNVNPGDDFYEYAGGGWMKANPLKPEYPSYGVFNDLAEKNREQLKELFASLGSEKHAFGTVGQKVTDLYNLAMDSDRLNREGAAPLKADLAEVAAFRKANLTPFIAKTHLTLGNPFFGIGVETDLKNSDMNAMWVSAGTSGLPDRDYYLSTDADSKKLQQQYRDFVAQMYMMCAGYKKKDAQRAAKLIYDIEYQFAEAMMDRAEARDYTKLYNIRTIDQLQQDYPAIQWRQYFDLMGVKGIDRVILEQPKVMAVAQKLMTTLTEQQMRDYFTWEVVSRATGQLSDEIGEASFDFYGRKLSGQRERQPRWKRAQNYPNGMLGEAVGELYVNNYFAHGSKEKMLTLIGNLRKSLATHIAGLTWMTDETKVNALVKLNSFTVKIGYPDKWRDYSGLTVDPAKSLYENIKAATIYETRRNLDKFGKPVDKEEWGMTPQTVNAYYNPTTNEICFPAAILQAPFFDVEADDATNYGAIGVVIGHEMTHGFDDQGHEYDLNGNLNNWWTEQDAENFSNNSKVLVDYFNGIKVLDEPELYANGAYTLGENIADNGGLHISYVAMQNAIAKKQVSDKEMDGYSAAQRFFLAYAGVWAGNIRDKEIERLTQMDVHSLSRWRVNGTLPHIAEFIEAWGIKEGDKMYLAPEKRVRLW